ncbi:MAG: NAD-dependent epimerase/dehydratase family protein, partial [Candidatus Omnitrophica bacterium]|nr:NAD-dependent epimerase/dehydratase family protein [Candidatus Omnitrophota bacterium]
MSNIIKEHVVSTARGVENRYSEKVIKEFKERNLPVVIQTVLQQKPYSGTAYWQTVLNYQEWFYLMLPGFAAQRSALSLIGMTYGAIDLGILAVHLMGLGTQTFVFLALIPAWVYTTLWILPMVIAGTYIGGSILGFAGLKAGFVTFIQAIPLGGTGNNFHFPRFIKMSMHDGTNVTEDLDLGVRILLSNRRVMMLWGEETEVQEDSQPQLGPRRWWQVARWMIGHQVTGYMFFSTLFPCIFQPFKKYHEISERCQGQSRAYFIWELATSFFINKYMVRAAGGLERTFFVAITLFIHLIIASFSGLMTLLIYLASDAFILCKLILPALCMTPFGMIPGIGPLSDFLQNNIEGIVGILFPFITTNQIGFWIIALSYGSQLLYGALAICLAWNRFPAVIEEQISDLKEELKNITYAGKEKEIGTDDPWAVQGIQRRIDDLSNGQVRLTQKARRWTYYITAMTWAAIATLKLLNYSFGLMGLVPTMDLSFQTMLILSAVNAGIIGLVELTDKFPVHLTSLFTPSLRLTHDHEKPEYAVRFGRALYFWGYEQIRNLYNVIFGGHFMACIGATFYQMFLGLDSYWAKTQHPALASYTPHIAQPGALRAARRQHAMAFRHWREYLAPITVSIVGVLSGNLIYSWIISVFNPSYKEIHDKAWSYGTRLMYAEQWIIRAERDVMQAHRQLEDDTLWFRFAEYLFQKRMIQAYKQNTNFTEILHTANTAYENGIRSGTMKTKEDLAKALTIEIARLKAQGGEHQKAAQAVEAALKHKRLSTITTARGLIDIFPCLFDSYLLFYYDDRLRALEAIELSKKNLEEKEKYRDELLFVLTDTAKSRFGEMIPEETLLDAASVSGIMKRMHTGFSDELTALTQKAGNFEPPQYYTYLLRTLLGNNLTGVSTRENTGELEKAYRMRMANSSKLAQAKLTLDTALETLTAAEQRMRDLREKGRQLEDTDLLQTDTGDLYPSIPLLLWSLKDQKVQDRGLELWYDLRALFTARNKSIVDITEEHKTGHVPSYIHISPDDTDRPEGLNALMTELRSIDQETPEDTPEYWADKEKRQTAIIKKIERMFDHINAEIEGADRTLLPKIEASRKAFEKFLADNFSSTTRSVIMEGIKDYAIGLQDREFHGRLNEFLATNAGKTDNDLLKRLQYSLQAIATNRDHTINVTQDMNKAIIEYNKKLSEYLKYAIPFEMTKQFCADMIRAYLTALNDSHPELWQPAYDYMNERWSVIYGGDLQAFLDTQLVETPEAPVVIQGNTFTENGAPLILAGGNSRFEQFGVRYGELFGKTARPGNENNGVTEHRWQISGDFFEWARQNGVNYVRVPLLGAGEIFGLSHDGLKQVWWNDYDKARFYQDVKKFLDLAGQYGVRVEFYIDYKLANKPKDLRKSNIDIVKGGRAALFTDEQFITDFIEPFFREFKDEKAFLGIGLNEPEYLIVPGEGGSFDASKASTDMPAAAIQKNVVITFLRNLAKARTRAGSSAYITVGVHEHLGPLAREFAGSVDYMGIHYYPGKGTTKDQYLERVANIGETLKGINKPWILSEFPAKVDENADAAYTAKTTVNLVRLLEAVRKGANPGSGISVWAFDPRLEDRMSYDSYAERDMSFKTLKGQRETETEARRQAAPAPQAPARQVSDATEAAIMTAGSIALIKMYVNRRTELGAKKDTRKNFIVELALILGIAGAITSAILFYYATGNTVIAGLIFIASYIALFIVIPIVTDKVYQDKGDRQKKEGVKEEVRPRAPPAVAPIKTGYQKDLEAVTAKYRKIQTTSAITTFAVYLVAGAAIVVFLPKSLAAAYFTFGFIASVMHLMSLKATRAKEALRELQVLKEKHEFEAQKLLLPEHPTNIAVSGSTGFIGSNLADTAVRNGITVTGIVRPGTARMANLDQPDRMILTPADLNAPDYTTYHDIMANPSVQTFYHLGGRANHQDCQQHPAEALVANVISTGILARLNDEYNAGKNLAAKRRFIFSSTFYIYSLLIGRPMGDTHKVPEDEAEKIFKQMTRFIPKLPLIEQKMRMYVIKFVRTQGNVESPLEFINKEVMPLFPAIPNPAEL